MWYRVSEVIEQHKLDQKIVEETIEHKNVREKFGIVNDYGFDEINSFYVNDFVEYMRKEKEHDEKFSD